MCCIRKILNDGLLAGGFRSDEGNTGEQVREQLVRHANSTVLTDGMLQREANIVLGSADDQLFGRNEVEMSHPIVNPEPSCLLSELRLVPWCPLAPKGKHDVTGQMRKGTQRILSPRSDPIV